MIKWPLFAMALVAGLCFQTKAQSPPKTRILILMDYSGSMWAQWEGRTRIDVAKSVVTKLVDSLAKVPNVELAFRAYGHTASRGNRDCQDTKLEVPFGSYNTEDIKKKVKALRPNGTTPIAYSLSQAASDFGYNKTTKNLIILITDGIEECGGDPCAVSRELQERNVILKPMVIGLGITEDYTKNFECIGRYFNVTTTGEFDEVMAQVVTQSLNNTTLSVSMNNTAGQSRYADVDMVFYNQKTGDVVDNYINTHSNFGTPDSFTIDPSLIYRIELQTLPPVTIPNVALKAGKHNAVSALTPMGSLKLNVSSGDYLNLMCVVRQAGKSEILHAQQFNTSQRYIAGSYDLEILTVPRIRLSNVQIKDGETYPISIPSPGRLELAFGKDIIGSLYVLRDNKQEWVMDIDGTGVQRRMTYLLQPGSYKLVYRLRNSHNTLDTKEKDFRLPSSGTQTYNLQ